MHMPLETLSNPVTGEEVTFLETAATTGGARTVVEIRLRPRGHGPPMHYHTGCSETFEVLEGELIVQLGDQTLRLGEGERVVVERLRPHTFRSELDRPVRFRGTIEPSSGDAENCFRIAFGLARDGLVNAKGVPRRLSHLAILATMSQSNMKGLGGALVTVFGLWARSRRGKELERALIQQYC